jgi:hypothetical protein
LLPPSVGITAHRSLMGKRYLLTTTAAFLAVFLTAGLWVGVVNRITPGQPGLPVTIMGVIFSAAFVWLLISRLRNLLAHPDRRRIEMLLLILNLAILILTFAWVHHQIGLMDVSGPAPRPTNDLSDALYFSVVTSTTLGYGDFIPLGPGRPVAALQALVGYLILGILVSTGFQLIAPNSNPGEQSRDEDRGPSPDAGERHRQESS